ncbi:MAG TPA: cation:proton antiporter, partial [Flexistipes sinusarabici]|nr:cation:proton antiporter [Flexistipes sinusarabici]
TTYILIISVLVAAGYIFADLFTVDPLWIFILALLLAPMGAPTDPTATFAIIHEYGAKGNVSNTIIEVAALDDAMGVFLFSLSTSAAFILAGD